MTAGSLPRVVIGGVASGVGKTTVTVAIARALGARGLRVALFKCGPDYLDPTYHARAIDGPSHNLDGWMRGRDAVRATFARAARDADVSLIEGVMGLYDGASPTSESGSTAEIAKWLQAPVLLAVDAGGMARSIAAVVEGFRDFDPDLRLAGAIANRVGGRGHLDLLRQALRDPPVLGGLPPDPGHAFPERHLGLRRADEATLPSALLDHWGALAEEWFDLDAILGVARSSPDLGLAPEHTTKTVGVRCRLGIARDEAFHFYYEDNLRRLESLGAELVPFSPVHDAGLPEVDGLYLGGGYPEAHAAALAANTPMREAVARFARAGGPVYAECGGLMYLTRGIVTVEGEEHAMVGLLPSRARMCGKLQALGYVEVETTASTILGAAGVRFRGHQFRYSELAPALGESKGEAERVYSLRGRRGDGAVLEGYRTQNVLASYVHAHWASNPGVASGLVESCVKHRAAR
ncbi:MAG TPA: cobyrinate a,c-diamide synthase [Polyangiaceae bacterium]|nr:cobyrinate a,c-diamide synthase [Polyangiaceae bacterium]